MSRQLPTRDCCGCKMCGDLCPTGAIRFVTDSEGFWYPAVDPERCISCGLCVKKCPVLQETVNPAAFSPDVYSAWILDEAVRVRSTSGGLYSALALTMLQQGGYLAGCVFSEDWTSARHVLGNTREDLEKIFRSKYFQSDTAGIFAQVKEVLQRGEPVLFCGTPCQNAALQEFLGKAYDNLIQCDFVCRGINSPKAHQANLRELEARYGSKVTFFNFKNKRQGWTRLGTLVRFQNGQEDFTDRDTSAWTKGYIRYNLYMRPSCEHCKFKKIPRISDISLGDFWGMPSEAENLEKGVSLVMVNTEKGRRFYQKTLPLLHSAPSDLQTAISGNRCIVECPQFNHKKRAQFFRYVDSEPFSHLVRRLNRDSVLWNMARRMLRGVKRATRRLTRRDL